MVTAIQGGAADAIVQFSVLGGDALLNDPDFTVLEVEATTHRQIWMGCSQGQFVEKAARQALALHVRPRADDRDAVPGSGRDRQRPRLRPVHAVLQRGRRRAAGQGHRPGQGSCSPTPASRVAPGRAARRRPAGDPAAGPADPGRRGRGRHPARDRRRERRHVLRHAVVPGRRRPAVRRRRRARHRRLRPPSGAGRVPQRRALDGRRLELVAVLRTRSSTPPSPSTGGRSASRPRPRPPASWRRSSTRTSRSACRSSTTSCPATRTASRACGCRRSARCSWRRRHKSDRAGALERAWRRRDAVTSLRRLALSLVTLFLLVTIVFLIVNVLPSDPGRQILGPFAPQSQVDAVNEEIGFNDPKLTAVRAAGQGHVHVRLRRLVPVQAAGVRPAVAGARAVGASWSSSRSC